jgi:hypothetical protein
MEAFAAGLKPGPPKVEKYMESKPDTLERI